MLKNHSLVCQSNTEAMKDSSMTSALSRFSGLYRVLIILDTARKMDQYALAGLDSKSHQNGVRQSSKNSMKRKIDAIL